MSGVATILYLCSILLYHELSSTVTVCDTEEQSQRRRKADQKQKCQKRAGTRDTYRAAKRLRMAAMRALEPLGETSAQREAKRDRAADRRFNDSFE